MSTSAATQSCPACGAVVSISEVEPLARVTCPVCDENFHVEVAFDHFVLMETLGLGGMGSVYKARDTRLDRFVALKILRQELSAQPEETARLEQEARLTAAVNHPHIVQMFSSGNAHGQFYLVMELVDFGSLDDLMAQHGQLPELQVLEIGIQIAQGLQAAQEKGLIHRDIKPANILFGDERTAKIGDFGLAVAAGQNAETQHEIWGTPYYVAPERLNNEPEDFRSDIFSLGATLFHALAGTAPIQGETTSAIELRELKSRPPDLRSVAPQLSRPTTRALAGMMAPDPRARFQSYAEVIAALTRAKEALDGTGRGRLFSRRNIIAAVAVVLVLAAVGAYFYRAQQRLAALAARGADEMTLSLTKSYDDARRQLIAGKYDAARTAFTRLGEQAQNRQPLLNWIRLHRGFAALLRGYRNAVEQPFQEIEKGGRFSTKPEEAELGDFFVAITRAMLARNSIPAVDATRTKPKALEPFATLLVGLKDWQQGDFATAATLLEQFVRTDSKGAFSWINEYRPLAQRYLADYRTYSDWKTRAQPGVRGSNEARAALQQTESRLQVHSRLSDLLKEEEAALSRPTATAQSPPSMASSSPASDQNGAAFTAYRSRVAEYDFAGALQVVTSLQSADPTWPSTQSALKKKTRWLMEWKKQLIDDLHRGPLARPIADISGVMYQGISAADPVRVTLVLPYGVTAVSWAKLSPKSLLDAASAFIVPGTADAADRQWRSAVFAVETGQNDLARALGESAAAAKPEYRQDLPLLSVAIQRAP